MSYFPDLSPYVLANEGTGFPVLNVGWLTRTKPFPTGDSPPEFQEKLLELCVVGGMNYTLGYHMCDLCRRREIVCVRWQGREQRLGSGEIWVIGQQATYAAPDLVIHYVAAHRYCPPRDFIDGVLTGPGSKEYCAVAGLS